MSFLPGWDSAESTATIAHNLHITAIVVLGLLFISEGLALMYDSRKERLVSVAATKAENQRKQDADAAETKRKAEVDALQKQLSEADKRVTELDRLRAPRHVSGAERASLITALTGRPSGQLVIKAMVTANDSNDYAREIASVFQSLPGWQVRIDNALVGGTTPAGIWLTIKDGSAVPPATAPVQHAFEGAGFPIASVVSLDPGVPTPTEIWLSIGVKK